MAKKKNKKNQKQAEFTSPPAPSTEEPVPAVPDAPSLAAETPATDSSNDQPIAENPVTDTDTTSRDQASLPAGATNEATIVEALVEGPTSEPSQGPEEDLQATSNEVGQLSTTQDSNVIEAAPVLEQEFALPKEEDTTQSTKECEVEPLDDQTSDSKPEATEAPIEASTGPIEVTDCEGKSESIQDQKSDTLPPQAPENVLDTPSQEESMTATEPNTLPEPIKEVAAELADAPEVSVTDSALVASESLPSGPEEKDSVSNHVAEVPDVSDSLPPPAPEVPAAQSQPSSEKTFVESSPTIPKKETAKQRRTRENKEKKQREEQEKLEQEARVETERLEQQKLQAEQDEQKAETEKQRKEQERLEQEAKDVAAAKEEEHRKELERLEQEKLEQEKLEQEKLEQEKLEQEKLEQEKLEQEKLEQERVEQEGKDAADAAEQAQKEAEANEQKRLEQEAIEAADAAKAAEEAQKEAEAEQSRQREELEKQEQEDKRKELERLDQARLEQEAAEVAEKAQKEAEAEEAQRQEEADRLEKERTEHKRLEQEAKDAAQVAERAQEEAEEAGAARIAAEQALREPTPIPEPTIEPARAPSPPSRSSPRSVTREETKRRVHEPGPIHAPRPQAVTQIIEDNRPPAPSPPVGRIRSRHMSAFDSEDDSDSALVQTRRQFRGGESRDTSRGSTYPPPPTHTRGVFASRVPAESYTNPPPPPPPGYHPRYYAPTAPPHYQNHGYGMSQQGYPNPNPYGPSSHSSSSPYQESWNQYPPGYPPYGSPQRHDSSGSRDYPVHAIENGSAIEDDSGDVFSRIAQAIPDLHVLLARYKETHGQLSVREELLRRASVEQEEKLRAKDDEIDDLKEKLRNLENKHSTEASRLRFQIGNLEEQVKELREQIAETEKYKKEAEETKLTLDAAMKSWEAKYKELEEAHVALERTAAEEKAKAWRDFDEWKSTATTKHDAEKIALAIQFDKKLKEADVLAENQRQEAAAAFVKEKDELRSEHQRQQREREASFDRVRNELETKLGSAQKDREEALKHERESREFWVAERETLLKAHQEDRDSLQKGWDEQRDLLEAQYKKTKDESDKAWIDLHADASRRADEEKAKVEQLTQEKEELIKKYDELKAESQKEKEVIKSVATNLESEKARLEKLMDCYGDIAEIKSKGDTYYLVSFSQLQKQIIDLAATHFIHLPVRPPSEDLAQVPSNLPSFLGDTLASRQVRAAYIAHTVSKLITYRVFGPFLFSLGRRYDKADSLFSSMSNHIRDKSTRKEAIWRQQTLLAAFTSSGAKQRINTAAGTVVEEIVNAVKHFADPKEEEGIKIAVKRIVKLAAETWRFARLEREMISATMPALHDEEHQFTGPEYWPPYKSEGTMIASLAGTSPPSDIQPKLLLRLFPVIYRESKHENFHGEGEKRDEGCIFHYGLALYDDAESVVQRTEELVSAGLPPFTTASPSTADGSGKFPPPAVPPPRDPPPPPPGPPPSAPAMDETSSIKSRSLPPSPTEKSEKSLTRLAIPPPAPSSILTLEEPKPTESMTEYKRPPPGPIDFVTPRSPTELPLPVESVVASQPPSPVKTSDEPSAPAGPEPEEAAPPAETGSPPPVEAPPPPSNQPSRAPSPPAQPISSPSPPPTQSAPAPPSSAPSQPAPPPPPPPPPPTGPADDVHQPAPTESAILPVSYSATTVQEGGSRDLPTPPHSRSGTPTRPVSPLFEAIDEIDALQSHRSRNSSASLSRRRSTHTRRTSERAAEDDLPEINSRPETVRRTSGYALSTRTSKTTESDRTERTDRTDRSDKTDRDPKSRYMCESRSAAIKALYPNSPLAGQSANNSSRSSVKSEKKKDRDSTRDSTRDSKELKREKSVPDNGTWDTNSQSRTSEETNTQYSTK
ncbi:Nn.00g055770.m01.CDS01 [Neocucurbitaria sp. VM-36]